jgi:hypothetical protein
MFRKKSVIILFLALLVTQVLILQPIQSKVINEVNNTVQITEYVNEQSISIIETPSPGGTELVQSNIFPEGNMEESKVNGEPEEFYGYGTGKGIVNNSYQDDVHSGTYGGYLSSEGTEQWNSGHYSNRYFLNIPERAFLDEDITMNLWYNAKANPNFAQGAEQYIRFRFSTSLGNYYINYYVSRVSGLPSNSTSQAFYDIRGPLNTWTNVVRNITKDFEQVFPSNPLGSAYIRYIYFWVTSVANPIGPTIMLYDDVAFTNSTGFNYFSDNGDFEDGDGNPWSNLEYGPSYLYTTNNDKIEGNSAMNMTAYCPSAQAQSYLYAETDIYDGWGSVPKAWPAIQSGDVEISFDWKYSDTPGIGSQQSYVYIYSTNGSYDFYLYFVIGVEDDNFLGSYSNYSYSTYRGDFIQAEHFGVRDTWNHFSFDTYEIVSSFGVTDVVPYYVGFYIENNWIDDNVNQLLIDDFRVTTYPAGDASFEGNIIDTTADPFNFWNDPYSHIYANITSDAYHGNYAANLTAHSGANNIYISKTTFMPVVDNLYTDFYWRLDQITDTGSTSMSYIRLEVDDSYYIHYILANNSNFSPTNDSNDCYYFVENHNQIGSWNNVFRNLNNDITAYYGAGDHNITQIYLSSYASGTDEIITIFDHIHFARDIEGPSITNPGRNPMSPESTDDVDITVDVQDNIEVQSATLYTKIDAGLWGPTPMTYVAGEYTATIPSQTFEAEVSYYFEATDIYGHTTELGSILSPYTYVVGDITPPTVAIMAPGSLDVVDGQLIIEVDADDAISGMNRVEIYDGMDLIVTDSTAPYEFAWDTRTVANGTHTINVIAYDNNGNSNSDSVTIEINNDFDPPVLTELQLTPVKPGHNKPTEISLKATDYTDIDYVLLLYRIDNATVWEQIEMINNGTHYTAELPAIKLKQTMRYYIEASDTLGQISFLGSELDPYQYTIKFTGMMFLYRYFIPITSGAIAITITVFILRAVIRKRR